MEKEKKTIVLMVNSECNLKPKCRDCYIPYKGQRDSKETVRLTEKLKERGYNVIIAGGETLLNPDYLESYQIAEQKYVLSNGILLFKNPEIFDVLHKKGIEKIRVSSHFGIQRYLRSVPDSIVARVVEESKKRGFTIEINTTISRENYLNVFEMCKKAYKFESSGIKFIRFLRSGNGRFCSLSTLNANEREEFFGLVDSSRKYYSKDKLEIVVHGNFGPKRGSKGEELSKENKYCPAGKTFFVISPENTVFGCPFLMSKPIGKLVEGKIEIKRELHSRRDICLADYLL